MTVELLRFIMAAEKFQGNGRKIEIGSGTGERPRRKKIAQRRNQPTLSDSISQ